MPLDFAVWELTWQLQRQWIGSWKMRGRMTGNGTAVIAWVPGDLDNGRRNKRTQCKRLMQIDARILMSECGETEKPKIIWRFPPLP